MESMRKSNILSWLLFVLISSSRIRTYSLLYWPKVYIPHWRAVFLNEFGYYTVFKSIVTVLFDTFTNNVSFLFLFLI
jgi:hypothetical protein